MNFDELVERAKNKDDSFLTADELITYVSLAQLINDYKKGYRTAEQVKLMKSTLKIQYDDISRLRKDALDRVKRSQEALTKSDSVITEIIKSVNSGDRDFERLFVEAIKAYSFAAGETITLSVIQKELKREA